MSQFAWCKSALTANHKLKPMKQIKSFLTRIHRKFFAWRIECEIYNHIFPHLKKKSGRGYPFTTKAELWCNAYRAELDAKLCMEFLQEAEAMEENYGQAFRYIMYRDLNARMKMYLDLMQKDTLCQTKLVMHQPHMQIVA